MWRGKLDELGGNAVFAGVNGRISVETLILIKRLQDVLPAC